MCNSTKNPAVQITEIMSRLYQHGLTTSTGGNISMRDEAGNIWITPGATDKGRMHPEEIVCMDDNGVVKQGGRPSIETHFHCGIYRACPHIGGIIHAHCISMISFSCMREFPFTDLIDLPNVRDVKAGRASCYPPGSELLTEEVVAEFKRGCNTVLIDNHGVVVGSDTLEHALKTLEELELCAAVQLNAMTLADKSSITRYVGERKPVMAMSGEGEVPEGTALMLCDFLNRGYQKGLFTSSFGRISVRTEDGGMIINTPQIDRCIPDVKEFIRAGAETALDEEADFHRRLYATNPDAACVVTAVPITAMTLSVLNEEYDLFLDVESLLGLCRVNKCGSDPSKEELRGVTCHLVRNRFAATCGTSVFQAFDKMEIMENGVKYRLNAKRIGLEFAPMEDKCRCLMMPGTTAL